MSSSRSDCLWKDGHGLLKEVGGLPTWWEGGDAFAFRGTLVMAMGELEAILFTTRCRGEVLGTDRDSADGGGTNNDTCWPS